MIYETIGQSVHLRKQFPQNLQLIDAANGLKILYKRRDIEMPYFHTNHTTVSVTLNIDTSKDYEFFVANLGAKDGMPGYFDRIICEFIIYYTYMQRKHILELLLLMNLATVTWIASDEAQKNYVEVL